VAILSELIRTLAHNLSVESGGWFDSYVIPFSNEGRWRNPNASIATE
jgi:hypothetical protein